ncbi:MAG: hypothetical protein ABI175_15820 [Polyangiales bacterium]
MGNGAPRRVLKSVVSPALGATFATLLVMGGVGCEKSSETARPDESTRKPAHSADPVDTTSAPDTSPFVAVPDPSESTAPEIPEPGKQMPHVGAVPTHIPNPGTVIPKPGKVMPMPGKAMKVGLRVDADDENHDDPLRPTRPTRRATDPTYQAMSGNPRRLA